MRASTGLKDKNGIDICTGDILLHKTIDGNKGEFKVKYSEYRNQWVGNDPDEMYDLGESLFKESVVKQTNNP